jgi:sugar/nucleoside kinase (ribokinase family)
MALKPNGMEALQALGETMDVKNLSLEELAEKGAELSKGCSRPVYLTLGEDGVLVCTPERQEQVNTAPVRPPLDIVGAGDMFIAALAGALAARATLLEAGAVANLAAAVTVEKLNQTGSASPEEILARYELTR